MPKTKDKPSSPPGQGGGGSTTPTPPEPSLTVTPVIAPESLGAAGSIVTGLPADITVTAVSLSGGPSTQIGELTNVSDGAWSMPSVTVSAGDFRVEAIASVSINANANASVPAKVEEPPIEQPPDQPPGDLPTGLSAVISYNGTSYTVDAANGRRLGDYVDPLGQFVQTCTICTHPGLPELRLFFRPDANSDRVEVVFELGGVHSSHGTAFNMGAYTAQVFRDGVALANERGETVIQAPAHYFWTRWRFQTEARPVRLDIAQAMADGLLPRLATVPNLSKTAFPNQYQYLKPMDTAGLEKNEGNTGDRPEIGPITEPQACYLLTEDQHPLTTVRAQLEGSGSFPWHFRDDQTMAMLDWFEYPNASTYSADKGDPFIMRPPNCPQVPDNAHNPSCAYVPFMLTGDPYALECMQGQCVMGVISYPPASRPNYGLGGGGLRSHAWTLRTVFQTYMATPDVVPNWLLPRSVFARQLDEQLNTQMLPKYVNSQEPQYAVFQGMQFGDNNTEFPSGCFIAPWMDDFECMTLGWMVRAGLSEWWPVYDWKVKQTIAMTDGRSGWIRAHTTMYHLGLRRTTADPWMTSWQAAWDLNVSVQPAKCEYTDPNTLWPTGDITYHMYRFGSLAQAKELGVSGASEAITWLCDQLELNRQKYPNATIKWTFQYAL